MMKDRALRRHHDFRTKRKSQQTYNSCIGDLSLSERQELENNIEQLRTVCVASHADEQPGKSNRKTIQERKHDITMKEQLASA